MVKSDKDAAEQSGAPVTLVVDYKGVDDLIADYMDNLSTGSVVLETPRQLARGTRVKLVLSFPGLHEPIPLTGTVRWNRDSDGAGAGAQRDVGIEFDNESERAALDRAIERIRSGDPSLVSRVVRILVVEDNPHVAQLIRNGLRGSGRRQFGDDLAFDFRTASNGREALDILRGESFDALIVDVYLPVLDGADLISHIRADDALCQLPIIAVSAGGLSARYQAMGAGADHFLEKPMRLRQIIDTLRSLVDLGESTAR